MSFKIKIVFLILITVFAFVPAFNVHSQEATSSDSLNMKVKRGDTITLGSINPLGTSAKTSKVEKSANQDIEWQVLTVKDGKALCLSKYAVDTRVWQKYIFT